MHVEGIFGKEIYLPPTLAGFDHGSALQSTHPDAVFYGYEDSAAMGLAQYCQRRFNAIGDVNFDGRIDIKDATEIQRYLAKYSDITTIQKYLAQMIDSLG